MTRRAIEFVALLVSLLIASLLNTNKLPRSGFPCAASPAASNLFAPHSNRSREHL
jgi:hypothetical protein